MRRLSSLVLQILLKASFKNMQTMNNIKKILSAVLLCVGIAVYSQIPTNGLVAYYPFNGNAKDSSGNGNNGTDFGPSKYTKTS